MRPNPLFISRRFLLFALLLTYPAFGTTKVHVITFGKWMTVQWLSGLGEDEKPMTIKIRPLVVDGLVKEYMLGTPHDVTDRLFVVRRVFRVNDSLPEDASPHWQWQRGGWLLVDRVTGHISALNLPEFDNLYSAISWYRDYAAYCGVAEDGKKLYAVVAEIGHRKPVLKKLLDGSSFGGELKDATPDSACATPDWQRAPARVTFEAAGSPKQTFAIRGHTVDLINEEEDEEASK